jgi:hypothetical protein
VRRHPSSAPAGLAGRRGWIGARSPYIGCVPRLICLIPPERAEPLLAALREHLAGEPGVDVMVERRVAGRASGARRAPVAERDPAGLVPPELQGRVRVVQRLSPLGRTFESATTRDLVRAAATGDPEAVSELWWRVSGRALTRLRRRLGEGLEDEDTGRLLGRLLDELPGFDPSLPLEPWLDGVVDRYVVSRAAARAARPG